MNYLPKSNLLQVNILPIYSNYIYY